MYAYQNPYQKKIGLAGNCAPKKIGLVDKKIGLGEKGVPGNSG